MFTRNNKNVPPFLFAKIGVFPPFFLNIFRDQQSELKKGLKSNFFRKQSWSFDFYLILFPFFLGMSSWSFDFDFINLAFSWEAKSIHFVPVFLCNTCSLFLAALALNPSSGNPNYPTLNNYFQFLAEAIANKKENFEVQKPNI